VLPTNAVDVLDLGAGTGAVTRLLRERVPGKVVAAEPDARMRAVLVCPAPDVLAVGARAERRRARAAKVPPGLLEKAAAMVLAACRQAGPREGWRVNDKRIQRLWSGEKSA
jgi:hypothetical protein